MLDDVGAGVPAAAGFVPVEPERLFDTRPVGGDRVLVVSKRKYGGDGDVLRIKVTGAAGVPESGVTAVSLNVTVTDPESDGFLTVYPCGVRPDSSTLNYVAGQTVPNAVIAPVSAGGEVCFYSQAHTHLLADVNGWFPADAGFTALAPRRLADTREDEPNGAIAVRKGRRGGTGNVLQLDVTGAAGLPAGGVGAVSLNVAVTEPVGSGFATVYPCGIRPDASNLNYTAAQTVANEVIAPVSADGKVCVFSQVDAHLIVDVNGWFATGPMYVSEPPQRLFDTRVDQPDGAVKVDKQRVGGATMLRLKVTGAAGLPATNIAAVSLNVTAVGASRAGYVTVFPCGDRPNASSLNYAQGQTVANAVVAPVSSGGEVCLYSQYGVDLVADVNGWFGS